MELTSVTKICFKNETYDLDGVSVEEFLGELGIEEGTVDMEIVNDTLYINAKAGTKGVLTEEDLQEKLREKTGSGKRVAVEFRNGRLVPKETAKSESLREHVTAIKTHLAEIEKLIGDGNNQHIVSDNDNEYEDALD